MIAWLLRQRLFRYAMVGAVGFAIDSGLTVLQVSTGYLSPEIARVPAFLVASFATYFLHQIWTFEGRSTTRYANGWATYLASTTLGALINYAVYYVLLQFFPTNLWGVFFAVACAAIVALAFNYLAAVRFIFISNGRDNGAQ